MLALLFDAATCSCDLALDPVALPVALGANGALALGFSLVAWLGLWRWRRLWGLSRAWSGLVAEASSVLSPFCKMRTRSPSRPRIIGLLDAGPKYELLTPGMRAIV